MTVTACSLALMTSQRSSTLPPLRLKFMSNTLRADKDSLILMSCSCRITTLTVVWRLRQPVGMKTTTHTQYWVWSRIPALGHYLYTDETKSVGGALGAAVFHSVHLHSELAHRVQAHPPLARM